MKFVTIATLAGITSIASAKIYFEERFDDDNWSSRWHLPKSRPIDAQELGRWALSAGKFSGDAIVQRGIQTTQDGRFYAISSKLQEPFENRNKDLIVQFTIKHEQGIDCGGGYIKLLATNAKMDGFNGDTPYLLMFGPDICGNTRQVHVILGRNEKHHLIKKQIPAAFDNLTHLYTLIIKPDNSYQVNIDGQRVAAGNIEDDWNILEPKKIIDPNAQKPKDWVDVTEIYDPEDHKPADWTDVPETISDPEAKKPATYDEDMDGEWTPPMIPNPEYRGKWTPRRIRNPAYKGPWSAPEIDNPNYRPDPSLHVLGRLGFVAFDLWQVKSGSIFDNILITDDIKYAEEMAEENWEAFRKAELKARDAYEASLYIDKDVNPLAAKDDKRSNDNSVKPADKKDDDGIVQPLDEGDAIIKPLEKEVAAQDIAKKIEKIADAESLSESEFHAEL